MLNQKQLVDARDALAALLTEYDTPENRANIEYDSLLAGSLFYMGETYFQEDRFEEAAARYVEVVAGFRTYRPESYYHLGLSKHYRQDYTGAIATFSEFVVQHPGSPLAPQALYYQGICYELLKDKSAAKAAFQRMIVRYPQHAWTKKAPEKAN
jgi:TolA-binding protein